MNGITGMLTLAERRLTPEHPAMQYLTKANELSGHLLSLINDILDMSRIEAGKVELEQAPFSLRALGGRLYDMFAKTLDANGIHYAANFEEMTADWVIGDELRISQVIINFLSNAVKFTSQGEIIVTFRQIMLRDGKVDLMVRVHDTGIGMKAEFISRIFRPFEQEDTSTTRRFGGTGLGMAISDQLVKLMGGQIVVESLPESSSDFTVFLSLPVMDGRTAARTIRGLARPDAADIPIYALSADAFAEDERLSRENGMNGHLTKPIDFDALWQIAQDIENRKETAKR
ncbi:ATP-binding response regulator [Neopoerus faecalis]|uniref:ATP-binding response regulator n=1 Tax=Neopoerus faecalis TaxID=3032125 RepID=UPI00256FEAC1|nr:ATP-binding protein [Neopoerus faecalis]